MTVCKNCGSVLNDDCYVCDNCGGSVTGILAPDDIQPNCNLRQDHVQPYPTSNTSHETPKQFFNCVNCGAAINEDNNGDFCKFCSSKLPKDISGTTNITNSVTTNQYHTHIYQTAPIQNTYSNQLPADKRVIKTNPDTIVGIILGVIFFCIFFNEGTAIWAFLGLIFIIYGATRKRRTNFCTGCFGPKDFKTRICPHCGKKH